MEHSEGFSQLIDSGEFQASASSPEDNTVDKYEEYADHPLAKKAIQGTDEKGAKRNREQRNVNKFDSRRDVGQNAPKLQFVPRKK